MDNQEDSLLQLIALAKVKGFSIKSIQVPKDLYDKLKTYEVYNADPIYWPHQYDTPSGSIIVSS